MVSMLNGVDTGYIDVWHVQMLWNLQKVQVSNSLKFLIDLVCHTTRL